jgi:hypothetical protein
MFEALMRGKS